MSVAFLIVFSGQNGHSVLPVEHMMNVQFALEFCMLTILNSSLLMLFVSFCSLFYPVIGLFKSVMYFSH